MRTSVLLKLVRHGSNLRVVHFLGQDLTATNVWLAFALSLLRPFGAPDVLISDGGPEFDEVFARKIEQLYVQHQVLFQRILAVKDTQAHSTSTGGRRCREL